MIIPTVLYGAETWGLRIAEKKKLNVLEMKCLRSMSGVTRLDRIRNEEVRRRTGVVKELSVRADQRGLRWFGHMERMDEERLAKRVMKSEVSGRRARGRPRIGWMDGVTGALRVRGMSVETARLCARDRDEWRTRVNR